MDTVIKCIELCIQAYDPNLGGHYLTEEFKNHTILAFRGSSTVDDWFGNIELWKTRVFEHSSKNDLKMHKGFYKSAKAMHSQISRLLAHQSGVILTGHSQGAAEALYYLLTYRNKVRMVVLFGSPRAVNRALAEYINSLGIDILNIQYEGDLIPKLPPRIFDYAHVGNFILLRDNNKEIIDLHEDHSPTGYRHALLDMKATLEKIKY